MPVSIADEANLRAAAGDSGIAVRDVTWETGLVLPAMTVMLASSSWILNSWSAAEMSMVLLAPSEKSVAAMVRFQPTPVPRESWADQLLEPEALVEVLSE